MTGTGPAAAVAALSAALGVDPGRGDLWCELATALVAAGRPQEAWDAAVRAVELAPQSAVSHRAVGTVASALGDPAQAESAYRHALLLDPTDHTTRTALARLPTPTPAPTRRRRAPDPAAVPAGSGSTRANGSRHAAPDPPGRHGVPDQPHGASVPWAASPGTAPGAEVRRTPAVGLPAWLGPSGGRGATRVVNPAAWRRGLIAVVRVEWLAGVVCFVGLAYPRTAPYTAGLLAGALVVAGAYAKLRWQGTATRRPPEPDRIPTYAAAAAVATAFVIIPAAMAGALTLARLAAVAAVTCATTAAVLLARTVGRDIST